GTGGTPTDTRAKPYRTRTDCPPSVTTRRGLPPHDPDDPGVLRGVDPRVDQTGTGRRCGEGSAQLRRVLDERGGHPEPARDRREVHRAVADGAGSALVVA